MGEMIERRKGAEYMVVGYGFRAPFWGRVGFFGRAIFFTCGFICVRWILFGQAFGHLPYIVAKAARHLPQPAGGWVHAQSEWNEEVDREAKAS
jgi:hypothetical protein